MKSGFEERKKDIESFIKWQSITVKHDSLKPWIDKKVYETWGFKAATRAYHIARTGYDVEIAGPFKNMYPTTIPVQTTERVPGAPYEAHTAYDISQILAWLAKERNDVQERLEWRQQIPELMKALLN